MLLSTVLLKGDLAEFPVGLSIINTSKIELVWHYLTNRVAIISLVESSFEDRLDLMISQNMQHFRLTVLQTHHASYQTCMTSKPLFLTVMIKKRLLISNYG